ncbi:response regulator [Chitinophaga sedimenti]|uniref:response regulator n=1 Tax=Chitinophaga sedimenti TaxID=2033606 RepID=UPI002002C175|nr:response regulator [Chitinophaga sedimenti]MCK7554349.1 response regulator [Chitinophaga sedimenti]
MSIAAATNAKTYRKILLAEDDEDDRLIFSAIVNDLGHDGEFSFEAVENGIDVLQYLDAHSTALPSLIILDQNMPKMNGRETLAALKSDERFAHIPVVIYSTYNDTRLIHECMTGGAEQIITKPDSFDGFRDMILKLSGRYLQSAQLQNKSA